MPPDYAISRMPMRCRFRCQRLGFQSSACCWCGSAVAASGRWRAATTRKTGWPIAALPVALVVGSVGRSRGGLDWRWEE